MDQTVVDMVDKVFDTGQAYATFSRVKTHEGLFVKNFKPANIKLVSMEISLPKELDEDWPSECSLLLGKAVQRQSYKQANIMYTSLKHF